MSGNVGPRRPPAGSRFRKGQSGNAKGRPRSPPRPRASAFDIVIDRTLTVTQGGQARELTLEEALQHKTYQAAIAGNRAARREVLKMIAKREAWLATKAPIMTDPSSCWWNRRILIMPMRRSFCWASRSEIPGTQLKTTHMSALCYSPGPFRPRSVDGDACGFRQRRSPRSSAAHETLIPSAGRG